jgi:hypothetical protein
MVAQWKKSVGVPLQVRKKLRPPDPARCKTQGPPASNMSIKGTGCREQVVARTGPERLRPVRWFG